MEVAKEKHKAILDGYYYACCPFCKTTLTQGANGTDCHIKCPLCGEYIHVVIRDNTVITRKKDIGF